MSKQPKLKVSVSQPCHENWDAMSPDQQGRFCGTCTKTVYDFTRYSDEELIRFFSKPQENICGRYRNDQINKPIYQEPGFWRKSISWLTGIFMAIFWPQASAQTKVDGVEVTRISGPGTEPVFRQWSDSMEFNFKLKSGWVTTDSSLKYIKVEGDSFSLNFERQANGEFDIFVPNVWNDSVYVFSFYDESRYLLGKYPIPVADAHKYLNAKIHIPTLPQAEILVSRRIYDEGGGYTMGISVCSFYPRTSVLNRTIVEQMPPGAYKVEPRFNNQGKIPVHLSPKVEYGTHDLPGIDPMIKKEVPGD